MILAGLSGIHFLWWFRFSAPGVRVYGLHVSTRYAAIMHCPDRCCYQGTTHVISVLLAMDGSTGLEYLLALDGEIFPMDSGYWTRFEVRRVTSTPQRPHGIRYSLTLHDRRNKRVLGFDNAHAVRDERKGRFQARRVQWDHRHDRDRTSHYQFHSAEALLQDFWSAVDEVLRSV